MVRLFTLVHAKANYRDPMIQFILRLATLMPVVESTAIELEPMTERVDSDRHNPLCYHRSQ
ncbi:hypothetical protein PsorP6_015155 [Peronosclerospora sorghi]|uniref:Uncharacterized protein n=1 Tax=Peronosclerospora sorghi TaxID=230839 RepID=A0ACC0VTU7_9STRA|nr:hypothetical protein PsorP6_015155 [Peronosclerospora sorghi]